MLFRRIDLLCSNRHMCRTRHSEACYDRSAQNARLQWGRICLHLHQPLCKVLFLATSHVLTFILLFELFLPARSGFHQVNHSTLPISNFLYKNNPCKITKLSFSQDKFSIGKSSSIRTIPIQEHVSTFPFEVLIKEEHCIHIGW